MNRYKKQVIGALFLGGFLLISGCSSAQSPTAPENNEQTDNKPDPKTEAESELLNELGLEAGQPLKKDEENEFPTVSPSPPNLPATDADLNASSE